MLSLDASLDIYGQYVSRGEYNAIVGEAKALDARILRSFCGKQHFELAGPRGVGDLESYWTALFDRDLTDVLRDVISGKPSFYFIDIDSRAKLWLEELQAHSENLLIFGELHEAGFMQRASALIPYFSRNFYVPSAEPILETARSISRLTLLNDLFEMQSPVSRIFVDTDDFGVVTVERQKISNRPVGYKYEIGFNVGQARWHENAPALSYSLDSGGNSEGYTLLGDNGFVPRLRSNFTIPTASDLLGAVFAAEARDLSAVKRVAPRVPNNFYFVS